jgi:rare lipoprotein A
MSRGAFEVATIFRLMVLASALAMAGCAASSSKLAMTPAATPRADTGASRTVVVAAARRRAFHVARAPHATPSSFEGYASYYREGTHVASGGQYHPNELTAAHRSLPFGTRVRVRDPKTGRSVVVVINDRGPFVHGRVLDLSLGAAKALGIAGSGVKRIHAEVL